jgi:hypothetical protein
MSSRSRAIESAIKLVIDLRVIKNRPAGAATKICIRALITSEGTELFLQQTTYASGNFFA